MDMKFYWKVSCFWAAILYFQGISCEVLVPQNLRLVAAAETNITISFDGIPNVTEYELDVEALYDFQDRRGWFLILPAEQLVTTTTDRIDGLKSNRIYVISLRGVIHGVAGNASMIAVRTVPKGPEVTLAQALPTILAVFVTDTPGATLCEISYAKVGKPSTTQNITSNTACKGAVIRNLDPNTAYSIRARVLVSGRRSHEDPKYSDELVASTAKLSIFGRAIAREKFQPGFEEPSSNSFSSMKAKMEELLLSYYAELSQRQAADVKVLSFESTDGGRATVVHHEVLLNSKTFPTDFGAYSFTSASHNYFSDGMTFRVAPNSYSLNQSDSAYELDFKDELPCTSYDIRRWIITDSVTHTTQEVELKGLTTVKRLNFEIEGKDITKQSTVLHSFEANSANIISQNYLLKSCIGSSSKRYFTRYRKSSSDNTTPGLEDVFFLSTALGTNPAIHSFGIDCGLGSLVTVQRVPHAIEYVVSSGGISASANASWLDSDDKLEIHLDPLEPVASAPATLKITTQPYDVPFTKEIDFKISTLPALPTSVTWPYRDKHNLTLTWMGDGGALGYYIKVLNSFGDKVMQEFMSSEPIAQIHDLMPGQYYQLEVIPYNYAGNTTGTRDARIRVFTDQDPPLLSLNPVNVSRTHITIEWTGGVGASDVTLRIYNGSRILYVASQVNSPATIDGLTAETEYNMTVTASFQTGISQSPLITYRTDPFPPDLSPIPVNTTYDSITIEWTGTKRSGHVYVRVFNSTTELFVVIRAYSPLTVHELNSDTEYTMIVAAIYGSRTFFSQNATYRTDIAPEIPEEVTPEPTESTPIQVPATTEDNEEEEESPKKTDKPSAENSTDSTPSNLPSNTTSTAPEPVNLPSNATEDDHPGGNGPTNISQPENLTKPGDTDENRTNLPSNITGQQVDLPSDSSNNNTEDPPDSSAEDSSLDWWVWVLIGVGIAIAAIALFALLARSFSTMVNEKALETTETETPDNGTVNTLFHANETIDVQTKPPSQAIKMETIPSDP